MCDCVVYLVFQKIKSELKNLQRNSVHGLVGHWIDPNCQTH